MSNRNQASSGPDWDANAHYKDTKVATEYDSARFSSVAGKAFNRMERRLIARAFSTIPPGSVIADVPCGTGRLAEPLLESGYRVHGMDISAQMLDVASQRLARFGDSFSAEVADAKRLDPAHRKFDAVLCARVLMHFELAEQIEFLRGVATLTSGIVVINHSYSSPYQRFRRSVKRFLGHQAPARFPVTDSEIRALLSGAGLREVRRYRLNPMVSEAVYIVAEPVQSS